MRLHKLKQAFLWELHDIWAFPFAEIMVICFLAQILSLTYIFYFCGWFSFQAFLAAKYLIILFCTLIPAKAFGECIEKRKVHITLMTGVSRDELFVSKLMATILPPSP